MKKLFNRKSEFLSSIGRSESKLENNSRVAIIGSGPAGSFFSYFLLDMASRVDLHLEVDIFESRDFSALAPAGCNMCGGIISETQVQNMAAEGINLPPTVIQRSIESYTVHMDVGTVHIETPAKEKRIAAVHRGAGPKDAKEIKWKSFDGFLQGLAKDMGANIIHGRVKEVCRIDKYLRLITADGFQRDYELLVVATGVNSSTAKLFKDDGYIPPKTTKTFICEYYLGDKVIERYLGDSMHAFLLNIPKLEFAAFIPKSDYATVCMLGKEINKDLVESFIKNPEVNNCMPPNWHLTQMSCQCYPRINTRGSEKPFADQIVFIGDCGVSRLYKDGIGAAYRTAKAAATTVIFEGISADDFKKHFWPICKKIDRDNRVGKIIFFVVDQLKKVSFVRRAILRMAIKEQEKRGLRKRMSMALWDMLTGSAPYSEVLLRMLHPYFLGRFFWSMACEIWPFRKKSLRKENP